MTCLLSTTEDEHLMADSSVIGQTISYYLIVDKLGVGGRGVVYKAGPANVAKFPCHRAR